MPQDTRHPAYVHFAAQWQRCRDAMEGTDSIKGRRTPSAPALVGERVPPAGTAYLPRPSGMTAHDYQAYQTRACWFGASARVRQGLTGLIFREPPVITTPARLTEQLQDITGTGVALDAFAQHAVLDHLTTGRIGILLDLPEEAMAANAVRPQWTLVRAEQIINWFPRRTPEGTLAFAQVVLEEDVDVPDPHDPYLHQPLRQWRELVMADGIYVIRLWRKVQQTTGESWVLLEERVPTRRGVPLTFIPFEVLNADSLDDILGSPPLLDVVDVNLSHYRTNADYQHELHMCSLATPYVTGWENTEAELRIGAMTAWIIPEPQARVGFLEISGHGLAAKLEKLKSDEAQMAVLGARLLEPQRRTVEAAETHQIRQSAEVSIIEAYALAAATLLTKILRWHTWWAGLTDVVDDKAVLMTLNTDFVPVTLDAPTLTALVGAWEAGAMTQADLYFNLARAKMLQPDITLEAWQATLRAEAPLPLLQIPRRPGDPGLPPIGEGQAA